MKKKVNRYQGGGVLRDRYGNPVKSGFDKPVGTRFPDSSSKSSSVDIEERSTKSPRLMEEEDAIGPMDYATLGRRARASSPFAGPKEDISETKETETESEAPKSERMPSGIASGFKAKDYLEESESKGGGPRSETGPSKPAVAKKKKIDAVSPKKTTSSSMPSAKETFEKGFAGPADSIAKLSKPESKVVRTTAEIRAGKPASEEAPSKIPKNTFLTKERSEAAKKSYYSGFDSKPVRSTADIRAGRGMKSGGKVSSASSRADGIAQRGKTRGRIC